MVLCMTVCAWVSLEGLSRIVRLCFFTRGVVLNKDGGSQFVRMLGDRFGIKKERDIDVGNCP